MFSLALLLALPLVASAAQHEQTRSYPRDAHASLARRDTANQIPIACAPGGANVKCKCPTDLFGDSNGVEINVYPGYQCAYPNGACTWNDKTGALQNTMQTNCPSSAPCGQFGCNCPPDLNDDAGVLINEFAGYQCAYQGGACTWDFDGNLQNTHQTNCPTSAPCIPK